MPSRVLAILLALGCLLATAQASPRLIAARAAPPLTAWQAFCNQQPHECGFEAGEPELIDLTPELYKVIVTINVRVNREIAPVVDIAHWGKIDQWDIPTDGRGDCEDHQLLKRKLLAEAGLPRRAMRMTVVLDANGDGHAVLTIRTLQGDLILDNLTDAVLPWYATGYRFLKRESATTIGWVALEPEQPSAMRVATAQ